MVKKLTHEERLYQNAEELLTLAGYIPLSPLTAESARLERYDLTTKVVKKLKKIIAREGGYVLGVRGGSQTSDAKKRTAQENGRRGGRPRKVVTP